MAMSITAIPPSPAASMACGAPTNGSTARRRAATNPPTGGATTTNTKTPNPPRAYLGEGNPRSFHPSPRFLGEGDRTKYGGGAYSLLPVTLQATFLDLASA